MTLPVVDVETAILDTIADLIAPRFDPATFTITFGALNPTPDNGAALTLSLVNDDPRQSLRRYTLQIRTRAGSDQREVGRIAESIHDVLHGRRDLQAGTAVIAHLFRISSVTLGRDTARRWERSDNYLIDVSTPATHWVET